MDLEDVKSIIKRDEHSKNALKSFVSKMEKVFTFPSLDENNLRVDLWNSIYLIASTTQDEPQLINCCSAIRILSREKIQLNELLKAQDWLTLLKKLSGLNDVNLEFTEQNKLVVLEAQKCLCNLVFNSTEAAKKCCENDIVFNTNERLKLYRKSSYLEEIKYFDVKLLFIITALCPQIRKTLRDEKNALTDLILHLGSIPGDQKILKDESVRLACEILKVLFNLTVHFQPSEAQNEQYLNLVKILRKYLLIPIESETLRTALHNDAINLLTNVPNDFYVELILPPNFDGILNHLEEEEYDMAAVSVILETLREKILMDNEGPQQYDFISPTATVLYKGACGNRYIRKYLRSQILPPLKDIHNRPEEGTTMRNGLCRLLTSPTTHLKDIIAEFLFVLCKKSVKRMIKYTGYGNAAGLFAHRGLLSGREDEEAAEFSSNSEDSETEEYAQNKHNINPVLGCYKPTPPSAMSGMTDEQKEYEAMKMVNLIEALTRQGTIKPCKIDENGKPVPIEHVLELQNGLKKEEARDGKE